MTYKLNPALRKIQSPITLVIDGVETEYPSGAVLTEQIFEKRYTVESMTARDDQIVIVLKEAPQTPDLAFCPDELSFF